MTDAAITAVASVRESPPPPPTQLPPPLAPMPPPASPQQSKEEKKSEKKAAKHDEKLEERQAAAAAQSPPPTPAPPYDEVDVVERLNRRFRDGRPSTDLEAAGVLLHQFDGYEALREQWLPCDMGGHRRRAEDGYEQPAEMDNSSSRSRGRRLCDAFQASRWSASIITNQLRGVYSSCHGGLVLSPRAAAPALLCAYARDGSTQGKGCAAGTVGTAGDSAAVSGGCIVGCSPWCESMRDGHAAEPNGCCWRAPQQLDQMLTEHSQRSSDRYNEVLLSAHALAASLPAVVEAIFFTATCTPRTKQSANAKLEARRESAHAAHVAFLARYDLTAADVPLVVMDLEHGGDRPFRRPTEPAPPPPPPPPAAHIAAAINARFSGGRPSGSLADAGVLVHQFETGVFQGGVAKGTPWRPCESGEWCDRWSCSLINAQLRQLFRAHSGLVLAPSALATLPSGGLLCSYPSDGATSERRCDRAGREEGGCVPGCSARSDTPNGGADWCDVDGATASAAALSGWWGTRCAFAPTALEAMLSYQTKERASRYNELVFDAALLGAALPKLVEAFFFLGAAVPGMGGVPPTSSQLRAMEGDTRAAHAAFLTQHGLTAAKVPLLSLDLHQHAAPFACSDCGGKKPSSTLRRTARRRLGDAGDDDVAADALARLAPTNWSNFVREPPAGSMAASAASTAGPRMTRTCEVWRAFDDERNLLFIHVPKTGGSAVASALRASVSAAAQRSAERRADAVCGCRLRTSPWMPTLEHLPEAYALQLLRRCVGHTGGVTSFAVVREPLAVRLSAWHYLAQHKQLRYSSTFNEYIASGDYERLPPDQGLHGASFAQPQHAFVGPCTILFQYERIELLWAYLRREHYPSLVPPPVENRARHAASTTHPTAAARTTIERVFADDYRLWQAVRDAGGMLVPACANVTVSTFRPSKLT